MEIASSNLHPVMSTSEGFPIHFLTGKHFLFQTLYCIHSLIKVTKTKFRFILIDDGTFDDSVIQQIINQLPGAEIVTKTIIERNLKHSLPKHLYSQLHHKREVYPHIKKLTDIHTIPGPGWKLVLDSDMLFWNEPLKIINWLKKPDQPLYMLDCTESYGFSHKLIESLCKKKVPLLINVGVIGLNSDLINWEQIENWIGELEEKEGTSYFLEQALTAMLIGDTASTILNDNEYIVNPTNQMIDEKWGILHHYVDLSKEGYFKKAWKMI